MDESANNSLNTPMISKSANKSLNTSFDKSGDALAMNMMLTLDHNIKKQQRYKKTPQALKYCKIYMKVHFLKGITIAIYILLAFCEIPTWCLERDDIKDYTTCDIDKFPNSGMPKLPHYL